MLTTKQTHIKDNDKSSGRILSFSDNGKIINKPSHDEYTEWCYWMFRNQNPVHSIKFKDRVYTVGEEFIYKQYPQNVIMKITAITWRGNYWTITLDNIQNEILM